VGALGVALHALEQGIENHIDLSDSKKIDRGLASLDLPIAPKLELKKTVFPEDNQVRKIFRHKKTQAYLGIDIGSTTTKYALIDEQRKIIHKSYIHTQGKPIEVTQKLLKIIMDEIGGRVDIRGVATTGSGRNVVGDFLNADLIIDEITAHARGAVEIDPMVDTIFEIGGQDSKYISISNTYPLDFDMNKVCAAGTGSFLHELANKYGINIVEEFQEIALSSDHPIKLAERCTVFMESDLVSYHQKGVPQNDLVAGLCYAIVHNYLNRVVGKRMIGQRVMFLGGPSLNKGVVAAFEDVLGRALLVPKHREILGGFGAALSLQEEMVNAGKTKGTYRNLERAIHDKMGFKEKVCRADPNCHNQCKLKIYDFDGRRCIWGGECGRYELNRGKGNKEENVFQLRENIWLTYMLGLYEELGSEPLMKVDGRPTVGMQRSLYTLQTGVLWAHFFDRLGFRLVLTPPTNSQISRFLPIIINMPTPEEKETGFYCPLVQSNEYMVRMALDLDSSMILNPILHMKYDASTLALELEQQISTKMNLSKSAIKKALEYALDRQDEFIKAIYKKGKEIMDAHDPEKPMVIVTGRPYNLYDDRLNLRLGRQLAKIGVSAMPMDFIDVSKVDLSDFPSMYWGLGAQILRTAKVIKEHQNFFGLHITNFSCGADSFLEHFFKYIMKEKPFLILELDEHSAVAGMMTRLEAFQNVIGNSMRNQKIGFHPDLKVSN
jgi:predicted CoA-substrate-specific enzyme activase